MAIAGSGYEIDFTAAPTEDPFVDAAWFDDTNSMENLTGAGNGLRPNGFALSVIRMTAAATASVIKSKIAITTNIAVGSGDLLGAAIVSALTGNMYFIHANGTSGIIRKRILGVISSIGSGFTLDVTPGTIYELWYEPTTGGISLVQNDVVIQTRTDTDLQAAGIAGDLHCGIYGDPQNNNGRRIGSFGADYQDSAVTIDDIDSPIRVTEPVTAQITVAATAPTTGNTDVYINADTNAAITPDSVTLVSGLIYDVVFTVPDEYAGLPYSATGYPVIISTVDGDATSANVPFLPVTGNGEEVLTDVSDTEIESSPALEILDQVEWTNAADLEDETPSGIIIGSDGRVTSYSDATTFSFRVWDHDDSTWGDWAEATFGDAEPSDGGGITSAGLTSAGITEVGLTRSGLSS